MKAVIVTLNSRGEAQRIIGPFKDGQTAANYSATLEWGLPRMILQIEDPYENPCPYTLPHTREWCGYPGCRES